MIGRRAWALVLPALLLAAGCEGTVQESFGIGKRAPDEFQIVRRQPLILPPDYELRPPQPGTAGPAEVTSSELAREALTGTATRPEESSSPAENALLAQVPTQADPEIRRKIAEEGTDLVSIDDSRFLFILDFQRRALSTATPGTTLDPQAEAARLRAEGVSVTGPVTVRTGSVPLSEPTEEGS